MKKLENFFGIEKFKDYEISGMVISGGLKEQQTGQVDVYNYQTCDGDCQDEEADMYVDGIYTSTIRNTYNIEC